MCWVLLTEVIIKQNIDILNLGAGKSQQDVCSDIKTMKVYVFYVGTLNSSCSYAPASSCLYFRISVTSETFSEYLRCWDWVCSHAHLHGGKTNTINSAGLWLTVLRLGDQFPCSPLFRLTFKYCTKDRNWLSIVWSNTRTKGAQIQTPRCQDHISRHSVRWLEISDFAQNQQQWTRNV